MSLSLKAVPVTCFEDITLNFEQIGAEVATTAKSVSAPLATTLYSADVTVTWPGSVTTTSFNVDLMPGTVPKKLWVQPGGVGACGFLRVVVGTYGSPTLILVEADSAPAVGTVSHLQAFGLF